MGRPLGSKNKPAEGGAVGGGEMPEVRGPIKDMLAGGSEDEFKDSLPEQTSTEDALGDAPAARVKRTHKRKAPKGDEQPAPVDKRLERANSKMVGMGAAGLLEAGFTMSGKPLDSQESEDVGDQFYKISVKAGGNADSWFLIILYTLALLAKLVILRTEAGEDFQKWMKETFKPKEKNAEQKEPTRE